MNLIKQIVFGIIKLINYLHEKRFFHYCVVGSSAFVLDFSLLFLLKQVFGLKPVVAVALEQVVVMIYVFFLNKKWSFKADGDVRGQVVRFVSLLGANYIFAIFWMWLWTEVLFFSFFIGEIDVGYMIVRAINIILAVSWNFVLYKNWVYRNNSH